ncbi:hypothetical protein CBR_g16829 [Chara braunii]|uniref:Nucleotide exchange factor Fes1 domain-containing protein n=1 Tax=Chara braunii TaxID=69332 RepID=A0A388KU17_CHABU|nr:hypothetical protein CBR_g16829 [Chara braunii]|eukprot:GBG73488.1 hypothetical protein CBR_g16829 [Chara braunii]
MGMIMAGGGGGGGGGEGRGGGGGREGGGRREEEEEEEEEAEEGEEGEGEVKIEHGEDGGYGGGKREDDEEGEASVSGLQEDTSTTREEREGEGEGEERRDEQGGTMEKEHSTVESMLHWAIEHSDPQKLKDEVQRTKRLTLEELEQKRKDIRDLLDHLRMPSDAELMTVAIKDLQNDALSKEEHLRALDELLILVEPIDNANDLHKLGGLVAVLRMLNSSHSEVRATAAWVLGKAAQNNPLVQLQILELGALSHLMRMVQADDREEAVKALHAVSAVVRNLEEAQTIFIRNGGLRLLRSLLIHERMDVRLKRKAIVLISQWVEEAVKSGGKTGYVPDDVLLEAIVRLSEHVDLDMREKALSTIALLVKTSEKTRDSLREECGAVEVMDRLKKQLRLLAEDADEEGAEYVMGVLEQLRTEIVEGLATSEEKDEL